MEQLHGKVAVITGAASGIGLAMARCFAQQGCRLVLADIEGDTLEAAAATLPAEVELVTVLCDVSDPQQIESLRDRALDAFGAVHIVCNNAGVGGGGPTSAIDPSDWKWILDVNLWGVIHGVRVFLPLLLEQQEGHIVNTASVAGLFSAPFMGPYNVSKYGVVALSETMSAELQMAGSEVGVSVLCPSWVRTNIATAARNKPGGPPVDADALGEIVQKFIDDGIDPDAVATQVVDAVRQNRFWIITHDDTPAGVRRRAASIVEGTPPPLLMH